MSTVCCAKPSPRKATSLSVPESTSIQKSGRVPLLVDPPPHPPHQHCNNNFTLLDLHSLVSLHTSFGFDFGIDFDICFIHLWLDLTRTFDVASSSTSTYFPSTSSAHSRRTTSLHLHSLSLD